MVKIKESDIQKAILEYLHYRGIYAWRNHTTGIYNAKGGGFIPTGMQGVADILGILEGGRFLAIEVKTEKGKTTENQDNFLKMIDEKGGLSFVARSIEDVDRLLFGRA